MTSTVESYGRDRPVLNSIASAARRIVNRIESLHPVHKATFTSEQARPDYSLPALDFPAIQPITSLLIAQGFSQATAVRWSQHYVLRVMQLQRTVAEGARSILQVCCTDPRRGVEQEIKTIHNIFLVRYQRMLNEQTQQIIDRAQAIVSRNEHSKAGSVGRKSTQNLAIGVRRVSRAYETMPYKGNDTWNTSIYSEPRTNAVKSRTQPNRMRKKQINIDSARNIDCRQTSPSLIMSMCDTLRPKEPGGRFNPLTSSRVPPYAFPATYTHAHREYQELCHFEKLGSLWPRQFTKRAPMSGNATDEDIQTLVERLVNLTLTAPTNETPRMPLLGPETNVTPRSERLTSSLAPAVMAFNAAPTLYTHKGHDYTPAGITPLDHRTREHRSKRLHTTRAISTCTLPISSLPDYTPKPSPLHIRVASERPQRKNIGVDCTAPTATLPPFADTLPCKPPKRTKGSSIISEPRSTTSRNATGPYSLPVANTPPPLLAPVSRSGVRPSHKLYSPYPSSHLGARLSRASRKCSNDSLLSTSSMSSDDNTPQTLRATTPELGFRRKGDCIRWHKTLVNSRHAVDLYDSDTSVEVLTPMWELESGSTYRLAIRGHTHL